MLRKKTISLLLKVGIVVFSCFFLYKQIVNQINNQFDSHNIFTQIKEHYLLIAIVLLMMLFNWGLESIKWRFLISKIERISFLTSVRAIFSGITVSAFTPNRVGEYGGRVFCLEKADRIQAVIITIIGSVAQLIITIIFGFIGILFLPMFIPEFSEMLNNMRYSYAILCVVLILLIVMLIMLFLNTQILSRLLSRIEFASKYHKYIMVFSFYKTNELLQVLLISALRYIVFTTQFFILLYIFDVFVGYLSAMILTSTMLFFVSLIPTITLTEIGVRGSIAVFLFNLVSPNTLGILSATFLIWGINLLLPALIGTIFIFTLKFFRT